MSRREPEPLYASPHRRLSSPLREQQWLLLLEDARRLLAGE
jgi:hypothetical protein